LHLKQWLNTKSKKTSKNHGIVHYLCNPYIFNMYELLIKGIPVAKGRPRFSTRGKFARAYTPKKTADAEKHIQTLFKQKYPTAKPIDRPINVKICFGMPIPKSYPKKVKQQIADGTLFHTKRPDLDNLTKTVFDSLNRLAFADDSLIVSIDAEKFYDVDPHTYINIELASART